MLPTPILRILDASFNRAAEGLRVTEDYVRFVLDDPFLTSQTKSLRHDLVTAGASIDSLDRHAARDTRCDVGTSISAEGENRRLHAWDVCAASLKRSEQSLRSLEEYGKLVNAEFANQMEALRYRLYTLEKAIDVGRSSRDRLERVRLCVLIDGRNSEADFERMVATLVRAGVGMIQLRDKSLDDRRLVERARLLVSLTRRQPPALPAVFSRNHQSQFEPPAEPGAGGRTNCRALAIVNDRADVAAAVEADGLHLGQEDLSVKDARAIVGTRMLVGVSTHNIGHARAAVLDGANYLGAGPTFPSQTKNFKDFPGLDYLREVAAEIRLPTFAIGGITSENLPDVMTSGIKRIAAGAAIVETKDPSCAAIRLLDILNGQHGVAHPTRVASDAAKFPAPSH